MVSHQFGEDSDREGGCIMYGEDALSAPIIQIPYAAGDTWIRKTNKLLKQSIPYPNTPGLAFPGTTRIFSRAECGERARRYGLSAWGYDPEKGCYLFEYPFQYQKMSPNLLSCGKNTQRPNEFV